MARTKPTCRFCLDTHNLKRNPLIRPCACRGSVAYVHVRCLQQWQMIDFERNGVVCGLCLTDYTDTGNPYLERVPNEQGYTLVLLRYPFLGGILVHYAWLTHLSLLQTTQFNPRYDPLYICYQIGFQMFYFCVMAAKFHVRHLGLYQKEWMHGIGLLLMLAHATGVLALFQETLLAGIFLNLLLGFYWHTHCTILQRLNDRLLAE